MMGSVMPPTSQRAAASNAAMHEAPPAGAVATAVAAVRSILTYLAIAVYVLLVAPPGILLAVAFNLKDLLYRLARAGVHLALVVAGIRYRVAGREHVPGRPVVFCANHESNVDPPVLFLALHPRLHVLHKAELLKLPLLGRAMQVGGFVPVERANREQSFASIARGATSIREGNSFLIFPEGTRSRSGALLPFKKGGIIMAIQAQAPILPVAVTGGRAAMRKGSYIVRPVVVSVRIGEPIETAGRSLDERDAIIAEVRARIEALLALGPVRQDACSR
jgi:1-acyl-sn-glycerol-3-phosphate acyltransferase